MKKILLAFAFLLVAQIGLAQDEAFKKDVLKVIQMNGSDAQMKMAKEQILKAVPETKQAQFLKEFDSSLPNFYDKMAKIYMETYTKEDIKAMIVFYESAVGKKIASKSDQVTEKCMNAAIEWSEGLQGVVMKYIQ